MSPPRKTEIRGRRLQKLHDEDESQMIQRRRARMRSAQRAFRKRQRGLVEVQEQKVRAMESAIVALADTILQSSTCMKDSTVVQKVGDAIGLLMSFNKGDEATADVDSPAVLVGNCASREGEEAQVSTADDVEVSRTSRGYVDDVFPGASTSASTLRKPPLPNRVDATTESHEANPTRLPVLTTISTHWNSVVDTHPFAMRLLHCTLETAHASLTGARGIGTEVAMRLFQYALLYHTRDELLANLEWFLGAGRSEMYRLWDVSFLNNDTARAASKSVLERKDSWALSSAVDVHANDRSNESPARRASQLFWNAREVEQYLIALGARFIASDTIEIHTPPAKRHVAQSTGPDTPSTSLWNFLSFDAVLPDVASKSRHQPDVPDTPSASAPQYSRLVLRASALFQNLVQISLFLASGPGCHATAIHSAIMFTAMRSPEPVS